MNELTINDAGRRLTIQFNDTGEEAPAPISLVSPHVAFIEWWKSQCRERHIPSPGHDGAGYKIVKRLLHTHGYSELQRCAVRFMLDHGEKMKEAPHFILFAHLLPTVIEEMNYD